MINRFRLRQPPESSNEAYIASDEAIVLGSIRCAIVRSTKRKTIGINVKDTVVSVRAPMSMAHRRIEQFVIDNQGWIENKIAEQQAAFDNVLAPVWDGGDKVLLNGRALIVERLIDCKRIERVGDSVLIPSQLEGDSLKKAVIKWYKAQCIRFIEKELPLHAERMSISYKNYQIRGFRSRWGSCSRDAHLQFNWLLVLVPEHVRHYVIVHELAHIKVFDHSTKYWRFVERYWPHWKTERDWLRAHQSGLQRYL